MKTAVIYARYSCDNQTEQSIEGQLRICKKYAQDKGIIVLDTYIDRAVTGTNDNRLAFQKMIADSAKRCWNYVIVYKLDRFSRNKYESVVHKKTLKDNGVKLLSAMEQIPDTPEGNLMEALLEGFNQYFSEELAQKVSRGIRESWIKGNSTGQPLYGYDIVNKKYVINEHEAVFVKDIFTMYAQGYTAPAILKDISARGATKRSGKPMDVTYIYNILHNVRYTGRVQHDGVWYDNIFPALVSQDIWDKIAVIKDENKLAPSRKKDGYGYILSGKLICGKCKRRMMGMSGTSQSGAAYYYYICKEKRRKKGNCTGIVPKQQIEDLVMETTIDLLSSEENIKAVAEGVASTHNERAETHSALKYLTKKRDAAIKASNNLIKAIEQGVFNEMTTARLNELETEITQLEFEINREQQKAAVVLSESDIKKYLLSMFRENTEDLAVRKLIVNTFIREIILYEDSIVITYNFTDKHDPFTVDSEHIKELEKQIKTAPKTVLPSVQSSRITKSFVPNKPRYIAEACFHYNAMRGVAAVHPLLPALGVRKCSALASTFSCHRVYQPTLCTNCKGFCFPPPLVSPFADAIDATRTNRYSVAALLTTPVGCTKQASVYCRGLFRCIATRDFAACTPSFVCARRSQMLRACSRLPLPTGVPHLNNANSRHTESALFFARDCFGIRFSLR